MKKKVLIVDNDEHLSVLLQLELRRILGSEYEVMMATDAIVAINFIEKETFAVVITDYMLPVMTGIDLVIAVRYISPETRVVLMTGGGSSNLENTSTLRRK